MRSLHLEKHAVIAPRVAWLDSQQNASPLPHPHGVILALESGAWTVTIRPVPSARRERGNLTENIWQPLLLVVEQGLSSFV